MRGGAIGVALVLWPLVADAQICAGRAPFNAHRIQAGGSAAMWSGGGELGAAAGGGTDRVFGLASVARGSTDGARYRAILATAGTDQPLTLNNRLHACPMLSVGYRWGEADRPDPSPSGAAVAAALHLGYLAVNRRRAAVAPTVFLALSREPALTGTGRALAAGAGVGVLRLARVSLRGEVGAQWTRHARGARVAFSMMYGF